MASERTPQYSTENNNADNIERHLHQDGHKAWGFVIYRCTYESDSDWAEFMSRLRYHIHDTLTFYNGLDMLDSLELTVIDHAATLADASTSAVREHFRQWVTTACQTEQGTGPGMSQRYRYCIQVDYEALHACVHEAPAPPEIDTTDEGFVNVIWNNWQPVSGSMGDEDEDEGGDEGLEPIEGCTQEDVGWMMVAYQDVMVDMYHLLRDTNAWYTEYRRPPEVARS